MHKHHIIPKHMGGSDDPTNLVELSIEDHAEAHKKLWEKYGKLEDKIAWLSLSKQIDNEQLFIETSSLGGKNNKNKPKSEKHKQNISKSITDLMHGGHSQETKDKISMSMTGEKNHMYGKNRGKEYSIKQSQAMKSAWQKRKNKIIV